MFRNRSGSLIPLGILALPAAGLLGLVGLLSRYGVPNPRVDPEAAARFASSSYYFREPVRGERGRDDAPDLRHTRPDGFSVGDPRAGASPGGDDPEHRRHRADPVSPGRHHVRPPCARACLPGRPIRRPGHSRHHIPRPVKSYIRPGLPLLRCGIHPLLCSHLALGVLRKGRRSPWASTPPLVSSFVRPQPSPVVVLGALLSFWGAPWSLSTSFGNFERSAADKATPDDPTR